MSKTAVNVLYSVTDTSATHFQSWRMEEDIPQLLTDLQCKELCKQMTVIIKRLKEVQSQLDKESPLSPHLAKICEDYGRKCDTVLAQYRQVNLPHTMFALNKLEKGVLCLNVANALKTTPILNIMKGLLNPKDFREVEEIAKAKAEREAEKFKKNAEFLFLLVKRGQVSKAFVRKHPGLKIIKENIEEFEAAKEGFEVFQEELLAAAEAEKNEKKMSK